MKKKGFTLIELLVVIAIIGLLSTMAIVSLSGARAKARDAKRVGDIKQIQTALELYYIDKDGYPSQATGLALGGVGAATLSNTNGWSDTTAGAVYMGNVPKAPIPPPASAYTYCSATSADPGTCADSTETYKIVFGLEGKTGGLECGAYGPTCCIANPDGIICH